MEKPDFHFTTGILLLGVAKFPSQNSLKHLSAFSNFLTVCVNCLLKAFNEPIFLLTWRTFPAPLLTILTDTFFYEIEIEEAPGCCRLLFIIREVL